MSENPPPYKNATVSDSQSSVDDDDRELIDLGYVPSFKREFTNLATVRTPSRRVEKYSDAPHR